MANLHHNLKTKMVAIVNKSYWEVGMIPKKGGNLSSYKARNFDSLVLATRFSELVASWRITSDNPG